jgi:hypothetical protein
MRSPAAGELAPLVDSGAARKDLGIPDDTDPGWWMVPGGFLDGFWIRRFHQIGARAGRIVPFHRKAVRTNWGGARLVLVRVDDFPRWDRPLEEFLAFHALLSRYAIPYALGVTPFLSISPREGHLDAAEIATLRRVIMDGVTLALHGFTHRPYAWGRRYSTELAAYSAQRLTDWTNRADAFCDEHDLPRAQIMIPPFDGITPESLRVISDRFRIITGGPTSLSTLGPVAPGVRLHRSVYLPSYYPHMFATQLYPRFGRRLWVEATGPVVVLTLHWAWEARDRYRRLESLVAGLAGNVSSWDQAFARFPS